jgi:hypothetical protein
LPGFEVLAHNARMALIQNPCNFIMRNTLFIRLRQYLSRKFGRRERRCYPCITCGLPYTPDTGDKPVDD